ncbi:protein of unknown function [Azospirillum baldaniorum]|uniref:Uncharacterized protein n=1 Tax=Azospirillum baldaniorum TaxID=1064539 RepID=A0A9P1NLS8_9PROT|nr:protein of unknown function [Azospirillum baldaniorum]
MPEGSGAVVGDEGFEPPTLSV